ncbi:MAG: hypothetical protein QNJ98_05180 [Planctomycetota bacterium]|nr:hypothetical protein [Planctomycetota bacterium]
MPRITMLFALALIATGVGFYFGSGMVSVTALIPAFIGAAMLICALIAMKGENARKHAMHVVAVLSLLGVGGTAGGVVKLIGGNTDTARLGQTVTFVLCLLLLVLCINSFVQARKARAGA